MATLETLSDRLRAELGDTGRSFVFTATGDGHTATFTLPHTPVQGSTLVVKVGATDVSSTSVINELTGDLTLAAAPAAGAAIVINGTHFRYFKDAEIQEYITTAFKQHSHGETDSMGGRIRRLDQLPPVEEYPVVILASTLALYTLATDASFDIDISAPDGVHIPRSERYRQLMDMVNVRKAQYQELCTMLGLGMYRVEVFNLRRVSRQTNFLVPVYQPQEVDDRSFPTRIHLPIPTYGAVDQPSTVIERDLYIYQGDDFLVDLQFGFDVSGYTPKAQIAWSTGGSTSYAQQILKDFAITKTASEGGTYLDTLVLTLTGDDTANLPTTSFYDVQMTDSTGKVQTYIKGRVFIERQVTQ